MSEPTHFDDFGMDTQSLAGTLAGRLEAMRAAGFHRVMLEAADLAAHPGGVEGAVRDVRASGLQVIGLRTLHGFEGMLGAAHAYKVEVARTLLGMCAALGCRLLLAASSTDPHAAGDAGHIARDLRKLATMALPSGIRIAYEAVSWARQVATLAAAAEVAERVDSPNFGLAIDSYHSFAGGTALDVLDEIDIERVYLVELSDFLWRGLRSQAEHIDTAEHFRVFPGQGAHGPALQGLVLALDRLGYRGPYSLAVANRDYLQLPPAAVAEQARRAAVWLAEGVLRRAVPLPHQLLQGCGRAAC